MDPGTVDIVVDGHLIGGAKDPAQVCGIHFQGFGKASDAKLWRSIFGFYAVRYLPGSRVDPGRGYRLIWFWPGNGYFSFRFLFKFFRKRAGLSALSFRLLGRRGGSGRNGQGSIIAVRLLRVLGTEKKILEKTQL